MRVYCFALLFVVLCAATAPDTAQAQYEDVSDLSDLRRVLDVMGAGYADGYVQPVTDAFGANMNAGLFRNADVDAGFLPFVPIKVYVGLTVSGVPTGSLDKTFTPPAEETLSDGTVITFDGDAVPTAFGSTNTPDDATLTVRSPDGTEETIAAPPGLLDTPIAPLAMPQVRLGTLFGTDAQLRYLPTSTLSAGGGSYGRVGLFGVALRQDVNRWIPAPLPLKLAVQGSYNQFSLENDVSQDSRVERDEVISASGWAFNLQASRGIPLLPVTLYGGLQYETFSVKYDYVFNPVGTSSDPLRLSLDQSASNRTRALAGLAIRLAFLEINADYAFAENDVLTTGIGLRL